MRIRSIENFIVPRVHPGRGRAAIDLQRGKHRFFGQKAEVSEQGVGRAVDVRRHANAARLGAAAFDLHNAQIGRLDQQFGKLPLRFILRAEDHLVAENSLVVGQGRQMVIDHPAKIHRRIDRRKIAENVYLLRRSNLDPRQQTYTHLPRGKRGCGQIFRRVVVCQCNAVQMLDIRHPGDVAGRHVVVRAGGQAGMDVQINGALHHFTGLPSPSAYISPASS